MDGALAAPDVEPRYVTDVIRTSPSAAVCARRRAPMSSSFIAAAAQRAEDACRVPSTALAAHSPWDELPEPALLSLAMQFAEEWPDGIENLGPASAACRSWHEAMM